jgi:hypothetical protein
MAIAQRPLGHPSKTGTAMKTNHRASSPARPKLSRKAEAIKRVRLKERIRKQLECAVPHSSKRLTESFAIDLSDLVEVARMHQAHISQFLKMKFPRDRSKFRKILAEFEVNILFHNQWHLADVKRLLPRLVRDAYRTH